MDLLFQRYASPFLLLENLILTSSLTDFINDLLIFMNEEIEEKSQWEFFLHKVYDMSWQQFVESMENVEEQKEIDLGATLKKSKNMLKQFSPESEV